MTDPPGFQSSWAWCARNSARIDAEKRLRLGRESGNVARDDNLKSPWAVTGAKDHGGSDQNQASRAGTARRSAGAAEAHLAGAAQGGPGGPGPLGAEARARADRKRVSFRRPDRRGARPPARRPVHQPEVLQLQFGGDAQAARSAGAALPRA